MSVRDNFVAQFSETEARAIEDAARSHGNGINDVDKGSDEFKWAICICIGYQCMELTQYRKHHGITAPFDELKQWIIDHGELDSHNGDVDYISAFIGKYNEYMPKKYAA